MNMTHPLPQCDCLNDCGDDSGVAAGTVTPCQHYAANQAERIDNETVARFSCALRGKLRDARDKGRKGWQDKALCSQQTLSDMLRDHVDKGDPRDVAAFAMFLWARGENIEPALQVQQGALTPAVARIREVDEFGPCLDWFTHWAKLPAGTLLYSQGAPAQAQQAGKVIL